MSSESRTKEIYLNLLTRFIAFRSISTDPAFVEETAACANWLSELFTLHGFTSKLVSGYGNPIVIATYSAGKPETALIYGHYDVQPASKDDGWQSEPFELVQRAGRLFARGAVDNKGQMLMHVAAIFALIESKTLGYNVTFVIEGDEETGSEKLESFINDYKNELQADFVMISDGEGVGTIPTFEMSFRGVFNAEVRITTAKNDMHSGIYGGIATNAASLAASFAAKLGEVLPKDASDVDAVLGPGLVPIPENAFKDAPPFNAETFVEYTGGSLTVTPEVASQQNGFLPSLEITGISSGYADVGFRNAIPARATIKLNFRLAPTQDANLCRDRFRAWAEMTLREIVPSSAHYEIESELAVDGVSLWGTGGANLEKAIALVTKHTGFGYQRPCGAAIPIVLYFQKVLHLPQILLSLGNEDCNMHGVDENLNMVNVVQGLQISEEFFRE